MKRRILVADYLDEQHAKDIGFLLSCYAADPMGGGAALDAHVRDNIAAELAKLPHAFSIICYIDNEPAGLMNCFEGFSTFKCKPLINIHDLVVVSEFRGSGVCRMMLEKLETIAKAKGCCKITLEVLEGNDVAKTVYTKFGFAGYELNPAAGKALFWQKHI